MPSAALPEPLPPGPTRRVPLGTIAGARSGDKGGSANIGVWVRAGASGATGKKLSEDSGVGSHTL